MSSTSEELAGQADQLQSAISYFRIDESAVAVPHKAVRTSKKPSLREAVMAKAPHMKSKRPAAVSGGGFDLDLADDADDLDAEFTRRVA
jgi:methyl-accepting chemotaxis protein